MDVRLGDREIEALTDLLASDGWAVLERIVHALYSTDRLRSDLKSVASGCTDMAQIGALSLSKIQEHATVDTVLSLPRDIVRRHEARQEANQ